MQKKIRAIILIILLAIIGVGYTFLINHIEQQRQPYNTTNKIIFHGTKEIVQEPDNTIEESYTINTTTQTKDEAYSTLFNTEDITEVNINISTNNWNYLLQNAMNEPYVLADSITIGNNTVNNIGIKTKGFYSLQSVWDSESDRFSFTVNIGKYIKKKKYGETQNFYGISKIALNNIFGDSTLMKEYLSYNLMTEMGVPTPYYSIIKLNINNNFWGIYTMVESIQESLVKRTIGESNGFLAKPWIPGTDLIYKIELNKYLKDNLDYKIDLDTYKGSLYEEYYSGLWENKSSGLDITDYDIEESGEIEKEINSTLIWIRRLNELSNIENPNTEEYKTELEKILNVDEALRYFAVNTYLVNMDSYQGEYATNYALYIKDNYATIIPWDYNFSFGYDITAENMINFNIDTPIYRTSLKERPLLNVLLQNDYYRSIYEKYLNDCTIIASFGGTTSDGEAYKENNYKNILENFQEMLVDLYSQDPTAFYTKEQFITATNTLKKLIEQRSQAVVNQLNDNFDTVTTNISMSDMGYGCD